jgi:hypothetical protein
LIKDKYGIDIPMQVIRRVYFRKEFDDKEKKYDEIQNDYDEVNGFYFEFSTYKFEEYDIQLFLADNIEPDKS